MNYFYELKKNIKDKKVKIGIIGLGYVGLPLALEFCKKNFKIIGFDIDKTKIKKLNNGFSYINHIQNKQLKIFKSGCFFTDNFKFIKNVDIIILCLPTPLKKKNEPDLSFIKKTFESIRKYLTIKQLIVLESSTYPGSTREFARTFLKRFRIGENFFLGYSPEREDPNNKSFKLSNIPKVVSGYSNNCLDLTSDLYSKILKKIVKVSNLETAEFVKLYENIYRSVNIALVNELKKISNNLNLDIFEIIEAAKTKPFGFEAFYPGPGVGGHCIPVDPYYLSWVAKKNKINANLINNAGRINSSMPNWIIKKILKKIKPKKVLIIGVAYKKDLDDTREAPAIDVINILKRKGIHVDYHDPFVKTLKSRKLKKIYYSKEITNKMLKQYDCSIIITSHSSINYNKISKFSKIVFDTRNIYKNSSKKIIKI
tara:strand:+ start:360 stop:1637 length:1278 start_codon:yes stop_codon:yes gene_type:complete